MTTETAATEPTADTVSEAVAVRRKRWPWVALLTVVSVGVAATAGWIVLRDNRSPEEAARERLQAAQLALMNSPGMHYTGRVTDEDGKATVVDLRVTNTGDASGTLEAVPGQVLSYLRVDNSSFLRGSRDAWLAAGFAEIYATASADKQVLQPNSFRGVDLASMLKPARLGSTLDPNVDRGEPVRADAAIIIDGRSATPIVSATVTTYVSSDRAVRIVDPTFDIYATPMSSDDVQRFYRELRSTVTALDLADDSETRVSGELDFSDPCNSSCVATATVTSTPQPFLSFTLPSGYQPPVSDIIVSYRWTFTLDGVPADRPDCSGLMDMPGQGTTELSCPLSVGGGTKIHASLTIQPVLGRARADALVRAFDDRAQRSLAALDCPVVKVRSMATDC